MTLKHVGTVTFQSRTNGREVELYISVDLERLAEILGERAVANKGRQATLAGRGIVVEACRGPMPGKFSFEEEAKS